VTIYAKHTTVPVERSRAAVEKALMRYGATGFGYQWDRREVPILPTPVSGPRFELREFASIIFQVKARRVRLDVPMPTAREAGTAVKAEAATRQRWRAVLLVITAKLEAVESGISTLEAEFLANIVTDDGRTIGEAVLPRLTEAVQSGRLLPAAGESP
jgi:hypothetical protein